jgi:hypothetical protein
VYLDLLVRVLVLKSQAFTSSLILTEAILIIGLVVCNSTNVISAHTFRRISIFVFYSGNFLYMCFVCFEIRMEFFDLSRLL